MANRNFEDQFAESLKQYSESAWGDSDFHIRPLGTDDVAIDPEPRKDPFFPTLNALSRQYADRALHHLERLYHRTESPIEEAMLSALCIVAHDSSENVWY